MCRTDWRTTELNQYGIPARIDGKRNPAYTAAWCAAQPEKRGAAIRKYNAGRAPEYRAWDSARQRTTNQRYVGWKNYGGRGILMCDEWLNDPAAFIAHVGARPGPEYSIDRIDNDGNYEPGNVRWATWSEQRKNQRPREAGDRG